MRAQVKLAHPVYSVRHADRGPAPITRLIHLVGHSLDGGGRIGVVEAVSARQERWAARTKRLDAASVTKTVSSPFAPVPQQHEVDVGPRW
jgi:hypothetical protein